MTSTVNLINTISVVLILLIRVNSTEKMILHLGVLVSQEGDVNLSGYIPAMNIALEGINNDTTLPFEFRVAVNDSMVSSYRQPPTNVAIYTSLNDWLAIAVAYTYS